MTLCAVGLWRMEQLIKDARLNETEVVPVRVDDVTNCYATLRKVDSRDDARASKYIVLDLSTDDALRRILKQVRASRDPGIRLTAISTSRRIPDTHTHTHIRQFLGRLKLHSLGAEALADEGEQKTS